MAGVDAPGSSDDDCVVRVFLTFRLTGVVSTGAPVASLTVIETGAAGAPVGLDEAEVGVRVEGALDG